MYKILLEVSLCASVLPLLQVCEDFLKMVMRTKVVAISCFSVGQIKILHSFHIQEITNWKLSEGHLEFECFLHCQAGAKALLLYSPKEFSFLYSILYTCPCGQLKCPVTAWTPWDFHWVSECSQKGPAFWFSKVVGMWCHGLRLHSYSNLIFTLFFF